MNLAAQIRLLCDYIRRVYGTQAQTAGWYERGGTLPTPPPTRD